MSALLRPRLTCFYCGSRSAQTRKGQVQQWKCEKCEAVNYLDENGEITDPPASETPNPIRFAQPIPHSASPVNVPDSDSTLFCSTCLKNQHLVTQALASYLPAPTDPRYVSFEESYPAYRLSLEERYPQVCPDCAPAVEAKIRAAGYVAKTDHLRRMVERTRTGEIRQTNGRGGTWGRFAVGVVGIAWWSSILIQVLWHFLGALQDSVQYDDMELKETSAASIEPRLLCVVEALQQKRIDRNCIHWTAAPVGGAILLGLAVAWWNNKLAGRLRAPQSRLVGWGDHFKLQVVILGTRAVAWWLLKNHELADLSGTVYRAAHAYLAFFLIVATIISTRLVKLDITPRVSFQDRSKPLTAQAADTKIDGQRNGAAFEAPTSTGAFNHQSPSYVAPFPITKLAPLQMPEQYNFSRNNPPTPPLDDDSDAMDWTPSQEAKLRFNPAPVSQVKTRNPVCDSPSPFYGCLPNAPLAPAHKLRNPPNKPLFRKATEEQQKTFFERMTRRDEVKRAAQGTGNDDEDSLRSDRIDMNMATPKLFLKESKVDTGLEAMFDSVFSIKDEPKEIETAQLQAESEREQLRPNDNSTLLAFGAGVLPIVLGVILIWWKAFP